MDMMRLMKQAQEMQAKVGRMQAELEELETEGTAGGGLVKVVLSGKNQLKRVSIDPSLLNADDREVVEDLIVAAHADAAQRNARVVEERMKAVTGGLPLPPGLKLF
jgi:nucleoid-associated protein EbfC